MFTLETEQPVDYWEVEALYDLCFAPGREALSSYRLRDDVPPVRDLCRVVRDGAGILAGAMLAFVISLDDVIITEFVKSAGQDTLPTYMLGQLRRALTPEVNAISTALLGVTIVMLTAFFLITRKRT